MGFCGKNTRYPDYMDGLLCQTADIKLSRREAPELSVIF